VTRLVTLALLVLLAAPVNAQTQRASQPARFSVAGGVLWAGGYSTGIVGATLRRNAPGTTTPPGFTLFTAETSVERAVGVDARFRYAVTRAFDIEAGGTFSQPRLIARIDRDEEADPVELGDQRLSQFTLEGSVLWHLTPINLGARARPFVIGGIGYLRQLDQDRSAAETGTVGRIGAGVNYWLRSDHTTRRGFGVRGEASLQIRSGGYRFEDKVHMGPAISVLGTFGF
jgi:hypothetical protein